MVGLSGLEKFSHLEDKIYRTIELTKTLRQEKENLEKELALIHRDMGNVLNEKERLETQVEKLLAERETIRMKVEAMLDAVAALEQQRISRRGAEKATSLLCSSAALRDQVCFCRMIPSRPIDCAFRNSSTE